MPSPSCPGSGMHFDCTPDTVELRCPDCAQAVKVSTPLLCAVSPFPAYDSRIHGRIHRTRIPNHPGRN